ncbi:macro domain-containing protein [Streptomyces clavuligerus]|nr:macro domain-containing protein [Streptomyces clavuligerus]ANW19126.1 Appr-1-p processing protein [Streptomyces clavuligerus]AXU16556.1 Appr-1-p processing protein [Streptomyces clavuligerus]MBY6303682.1 macro domain-containing protein [Streptomyces clavuligerus]QCS09317.1 Appr-1-p processing protein [Streptomyces clavuligerus]QPJ94152.1 Appr-1-p processing protein [Streptomyces clavuligerus]
MSQEQLPASPPAYDQLLEELRNIRRPGLAGLRGGGHTALRTAALAGGFCGGPDDIPAGIEALLKAAVRRLGEGDLLGRAAAHTFGLLPDRRGAPAPDRRKMAAAVYGVTSERFRKHQEPQVLQQLAEAVLAVLREPPVAALPPAALGATGPERPPKRIEQVPVGGRGTVTLHVSPVELLRDIDVLVSSENVYLEMSKTFRPTVSGSLRLAAAVRDPAGEIVDDVLVRELGAWLRTHGRPGLPVRPGTVVPTSSGALAVRGIRRIYHAAVVVPHEDGYRVDPSSIARAVSACFALAREESERGGTPLRSICFPLLGAGHGGLDRALSATWLRWAIRDELAKDPDRQVHLVVRDRATADAIRPR